MHVDIDSQKLIADQKSGHGTLKLTVSQKWTDEINWFFACWYKFSKTKSWFDDF